MFLLANLEFESKSTKRQNWFAWTIWSQKETSWAVVNFYLVLLTRNKQPKTKRKNKKMAKKNIKVRDLKPKKDAKGGGGGKPNPAHIATGGGSAATGGGAPTGGGVPANWESVYKPPCGPNPQGGFVSNNKSPPFGGLSLFASRHLTDYRIAAASCSRPSNSKTMRLICG
jgi:hypothetical protein